jgi:hypothetical protein
MDKKGDFAHPVQAFPPHFHLHVPWSAGLPWITLPPDPRASRSWTLSLRAPGLGSAHTSALVLEG